MNEIPEGSLTEEEMAAIRANSDLPEPEKSEKVRWFTFKLKRMTAAIFIIYKIVDMTWLYGWPEHHHIALLTKAMVHESVLITLITTQDLLTWGALYIYGWAKIKGAD